MYLANLTIKKKFTVLIAVMVAGFVAFGTITYRTVDKVKVNGPLYANIITGKDLVADILPPPEYIIESYLTTMQLVATSSAADREALEKKFAQLHKDYDDRQEYWKKNLEAGEIKTLITQVSADPAHRFYTLVEGRLIPLVREGKSQEAAALMNGEVQAAYAEHRAAIDKLVVLATEFSARAEEQAASELTAGGRLLGGLAVGVTAFLVVVSVVLARGVIKGLKTLEARLQDVAEGEGDLTKRVEISGRDEIGMVAHWFNLFIGTVERVVAEVKSGAAQIDAGGAQIASASQSMAQGASEQASSLQQISASVEQMSGQTQQSAENARQASSLAQESKQAADRGQREMTQMTGAVNEIKQSSAEISKIIKVIDEIAFQTNLLALNAAVEAARAGEAGKGFAVVAEEVRNLAQRSAEAAKSTATMIEESVKRSENGVQIAARVGTSLAEINSATNKVNALLSEIASASSEQATGIEQINQGVSQLDQVTQQAAGNSEEVASSAEELSSQVASLNELVNRFKVGAATIASSGARTPTVSGGSARLNTKAGKVATGAAKAGSGTSARSGASKKNAKLDPEQVIPMTSDEVLATF